MNTVICGPPGSGKTTIAKKDMRWGDILLDIDAIFHAITGLPYYDKPKSLLPLVLAIRDFIIDELATGEYGNAWIITSGSSISDRQRLRDDLNAKILVLEISPSECLYRIANDNRRSGKIDLWRDIVYRWWKNYVPDNQDIIIGNDRIIEENDNAG